MYSFIINASLISLFFIPNYTVAENAIEAMCKGKAKEVAVETYKSCVTENKQAEISRIRKDYQQKLSELKEYYNKELKKLSGEKNQGTAQTTPLPTPSVVRKQAPEKPVVGIAKKLPTKQQDNGPALPVDNETQEIYKDNSPDDAQIEIVNPETTD